MYSRDRRWHRAYFVHRVTGKEYTAEYVSKEKMARGIKRIESYYRQVDPFRLNLYSSIPESWLPPVEERVDRERCYERCGPHPRGILGVRVDEDGLHWGIAPDRAKLRALIGGTPAKTTDRFFLRFSEIHNTTGFAAYVYVNSCNILGLNVHPGPLVRRTPDLFSKVQLLEAVADEDWFGVDALLPSFGVQRIVTFKEYPS